MNYLEESVTEDARLLRPGWGSALLWKAAILKVIDKKVFVESLKLYIYFTCGHKSFILEELFIFLTKRRTVKLSLGRLD